MSTKIEWVRNQDGSQGKSWNPVTGCTKVSPGCKNCYAERMARRQVAMGLARHERGSENDDTWTAYSNAIDPDTGRWSGEITCRYEELDAPLRWKKPRRIFVCSMSDLFHRDVPTHFIARVWDVMRQCPQHTFQILTKQSGAMLSILLDWDIVLPNVWLGVSIENSDYLWRIDELMKCPAAVRFVSAEPLLGDIDLCFPEPLTGNEHSYLGTDSVIDKLDWIIVGGESGPGARPMDPNWARGIRDQCVAAGVPFFFKQWGSAKPDVLEARRWLHAGWNPDERKHGRLLDGRTWDQMPEVR